ncbi:N-formylglutamate amidohydrolase [Allopusillimonas soli]|uniref:N-formylglutamate amidohydrolase n=1 Tax=Allopusillimonas soli TaxID=659016 RepID=A0A853FDB6_9BURK|nr:N-formylglutamate amidohydrolase [Allopusillimonas soli]NYT38063.1 N-formylglutamate amidohydrolase [Allopusillimonas soli]TEA73948.1 N-formylglutamate amidohydrolase [Allopusillimonas soli]
MRFADSDFDPYTLSLPTASPIPLVCDSPHSGTTYPADFQPALAVHILRTGEDTYVDELWQSIPSVGGTLLAANFPRSYIDPNREPDDIDPNLLAEPWTTALHPSEKTRLGHGLIWASARNQPIYDRKLWVGEVENRIGTYYQPYHDALRKHVDGAHARHGVVWHLNLHSMPSDSYEILGMDVDRPLADFVLGDRDGVTCDPSLVGIIEDFLVDRGYTVARNDPFKGVALIARIGRPEENRHSLQIEINRALYMDEASFEKISNFENVQRDLSELSVRIADFVRSVA